MTQVKTDSSIFEIIFPVLRKGSRVGCSGREEGRFLESLEEVALKKGSIERLGRMVRSG